MPALEYLAPADVIIIVDVPSFTTCVDLALSRGAMVYPYQSNAEDSATEFARDHQAELAGRRSESAARFSLSPKSMGHAAPGDRIVLPSPNGSTLSFRAAAASGVDVLAACLRNGASVARFAGQRGSGINVIPAGERWPDGSIRFSLEDLLGVGAIVSHFDKGVCSPEAVAARSAFEAVRGDLRWRMDRTASGRELIERGFAEDVDLAAEHDVSEAIPILLDGAFVDADNTSNE